MAQSRGKRWVFTLNNYTDDEEEAIKALDVEYLVYGREVGAQGTPHLQGFILFRDRKRLGQVRELVSPRGHYELARGDNQQNRTYCTKDGDFFELGECPASSQGKRSDLTEFIAHCDDFAKTHKRAPTTPEIARSHPEIAIKYPRATKVVRLRAQPPSPGEVELQDWQADLLSELADDADDRSVLFYIDGEGNKGKSWFQRYYCDAYDDAQQLFVGKSADIAYTVEETKRVFFFNVARGQMEFLQYPILEQLKDKRVFSSKYVSAVKRFPTNVHVVVFCNEPPDMNKLSHDRYKLHYL